MAVRAAVLACAISAASCFHAPVVLSGSSLKSNALLRSPMVTAVGRRSTFCAPRMSDMSDMTIEMLKRVEKTLGELPETELIRTVCAKVAAKVATLRTGSKSSATATAATQTQIFDSDEDSDKYYGIGESSSKDLEDSLPTLEQRRAARPTQASLPKTQAAPSPPPAPAASTPTPVKRAGSTEATSGSRSKYLDIKPIDNVKTATDESVVDDDEWTKEYVKTFGSKPNLDPLIDDETPRPPPRAGEIDGFAKIRLVQANAKSYPTPQDYMDALNAAIFEWKAERSKRGELAGAVVSDRYIDQLNSVKGGSSAMLDSVSARKFTLDSMLVEEKGVDSNGNERGVLVDAPGSMGMAGVQVGDALLEVNGAEVQSYADLRTAMSKIHSTGELSAEVVIQRQGKPTPERIRNLKLCITELK
ncbi:hypothetical protein GUITHDRAFT_132756 [Guillardia theta CCMP2712]|uniref:PDZ domain-containing protein n=1 Tax=Guillardia theta (strain CCMP2712) TaxID=905079 RepID=L1JZX0_GUITC|nr:hypothetical protein GUITHDRAFT_132756 [Guillardia theta CCMP2712]EKX53668.1 hypothetical protein GUITHDRAFT_132756 [Guillardia theta CCMP2712]|eukprot:XP_005840648.1 hypothetical protein GUITHDRAFT_132756 [Guillardia theta CCMP2712]